MNFDGIKINPSILSADFCNLLADIKSVEGVVDFLHIDVMDGHYVNNISFGLPVIRCIRPKTDLFFDVHLMITNPEQFIKPFADAGADSITFHYECTNDPASLIKEIKALGKKAGIAIHPDTDVEKIFPFIPDLDLVLLMSVVPGLGGQSILPECYDRLKKIRAEIDRTNSNTVLSVDGGINTKTIKDVVDSGANLLVAGSAVFAQPEPGKAVEELIKCAGKSL